MRIEVNRWCKGQIPWGVFTNLGPGMVNREDREGCGGWYLSIHLGAVRVSAYGRGWAGGAV